MTQFSQTNKVRVVVVDDSPLMLKMISGGLVSDGDIDVVGLAKDAQEARQLIKATNPDVVTLDVEMPGMNGLEFLEKIMSLRPMPVIMVSTLTTAGTDVTLNALDIGAVDAVAKPSGRDSLAVFGAELRQKVRMARSAKVQRREPGAARVRTAVNVASVGVPAISMNHGCELIAIGSSTGGVTAVTELVSCLPSNCPPIVITQHMPARFTSRFASRLGHQFPFDVKEAEEGELLRPGEFAHALSPRE